MHIIQKSVGCHLDADFNQVLLVHFFLKFSQYYCETSKQFNLAKKNKTKNS